MKWTSTSSFLLSLSVWRTLSVIHAHTHTHTTGEDLSTLSKHSPSPKGEGSETESEEDREGEKEQTRELEPERERREREREKQWEGEWEKERLRQWCRLSWRGCIPGNPSAVKACAISTDLIKVIWLFARSLSLSQHNGLQQRFICPNFVLTSSHSQITYLLIHLMTQHCT